MFREIIATEKADINIGKVAENYAERVAFNVKELFYDELGTGGTVTLVHRRPKDTDAYPCSVTVQGDFCYWVVSSADLTKDGYGKAELIYTIGDQVAKSITFQTCIHKSLTQTEDVPEPWQSWYDDVIQAGADAQEAKAEWENMEAEATALAEGETPTAHYEDGVLTLGIPKGDKGDRGYGIVSIAMNTSGQYYVVYEDGHTQTFGNDFHTEMLRILGETEDARDATEGYKNTAVQSATTATEQATIATTKATEATASATTATEKANIATQKATDAGTSAQTATEKAQDAQGYANSAELAKQGAEGFAEDAGNYASDAEGFKNLAETAKSGAETAKGLAEQAKTDAEGFADDAEDAKDLAEGFATDARGYSQSAEQSAGDASTSATNASTSATNAENAKTDAQSAKTDAESARDLAEDYKNSAHQSATDAEDARTDIQDSIDGVAQEATAQDMLDVLQEVNTNVKEIVGKQMPTWVDTLPTEGEEGKTYITYDGVYHYENGEYTQVSGGDLNGFTFNLGLANEVILGYINPDDETDVREATFPTESTAEDIIDDMDSIIESLKKMAESEVTE